MDGWIDNGGMDDSGKIDTWLDGLRMDGVLYGWLGE